MPQLSRSTPHKFGFVINIATGHIHYKISKEREIIHRECIQLEHQCFLNTWLLCIVANKNYKKAEGRMAQLK